MHSDILVIGSGFAAYQLIKSMRRIGSEASITVITADDGDDYNKPDLSHVFSKRQSASDLVTLSADEFATQHNVSLYRQHRVSELDAAAKTLVANGERFSFDKLVIATGASTFMPPIGGDAVDQLIRHNSLQEYQQGSEALSSAKQLLVIGGGLIGVEVALDLAVAGKSVTLVEPNPRLMINLLPDYVEAKLRQALANRSITVICGAFVEAISAQGQQQMVQLSDGKTLLVDQALLCTGLRANTALAQQAGLATNKGIVVDEQMQTSAADIYALGDCAEFDGEVRAFLQPIVVSASALAKTLAGTPTKVTLPKMMVKVKTPDYPIQQAGITDDAAVHCWRYESYADGLVAKAFDQADKLIGFVVGGAQVSQAFPLLRQL